MKTAFISNVNNKFAYPFKVMLYSLLYNNPKFNYDYIVLENNHKSQFDKTHKKDILNIYPNVKFINLNLESYKQYTSALHGQGTVRRWLNNEYSFEEVLSRFEIFNFEEYDKIIYLDCDLIINTTLDDFIQNYNDYECYGGMHSAENFFNGGVLIINKLNNTFNDYKNRCLDILNSSDEGSYRGNQMILNKCFENSNDYFPTKYNLTVCHHQHIPEKNKSVGCPSYDNAILHYVGAGKPWDEHGSKFSNYALAYSNPKTRDNFINVWNFYSNKYSK